LSFLENPSIPVSRFNNTSRFIPAESGDSDLLMSYEGCSDKSVELEPVVQLGKRKTTPKYWGELHDLTSIHSHNKSVIQHRKQAKPYFKVISTSQNTILDKPLVIH